MGTWLSKLWGGDADKPDPKSGLSRRDIYMIQRTWVPIYNEASVYGLEIFKRLFRSAPDSKLLFKLFRDMNEEELSKSVQFKAHLINFMSTFDMIVNNLSQPELAAAMIQKVGRNHKGHKATVQQFEVLIDIFLEFFRTDRGLKPQELAAWTGFLTFFQKEVITTLI